MNEVKQAFSLSEQDKKKAHELYIESVKELVHKNYLAATDDAFVDLSARFGMKWLLNRGAQASLRDAFQHYAQANTAFNYANIHYREAEAFIALSKRIVPTQERVSDRQLHKIAAQMNYLLTATTPEAIRHQLPF